jgi:hypothetical protein
MRRNRFDSHLFLYQLSTISLPSLYHLSTISLPSLYHLSTISLPSLYHLPIWNAANLNGDLEFTAVAESIVKGVDLLRLIRHASPILRLRTTVGLVRRIAQVEIRRPNIAV